MCAGLDVGLRWEWDALWRVSRQGERAKEWIYEGVYIGWYRVALDESVRYICTYPIEPTGFLLSPSKNEICFSIKLVARRAR